MNAPAVVFGPGEAARLPNYGNSVPVQDLGHSRKQKSAPARNGLTRARVSSSRRRTLLVTALAAIAAALALAPSTGAAVPQIVSTGSSDGRATVTWSLPTGVEATSIELALTPDVDALYGFFPLETRIEVDSSLAPTQTSWTSDAVFPNGTYFVHVEGRTGPVHDWSPVAQLVVNDASITPILRSAGHVNGRATATWSLPSGVEVTLVEVASKPAEKADGRFVSENLVDLRSFLRSRVTSWTSAQTLPPGTYYLHVASRHTNCLRCPTRNWSETKSFVVGEAGSGDSDDSGASGNSGSGAKQQPAKRRDRGTVVRIIAGDALVVKLETGRREHVRLIGIDAPELRQRECYARNAKRRVAKLALGKRVVLQRDRTQQTRDRFQRRLAYVRLPGRADLGRKLVARGYARVYVRKKAFERVAAYRKVQRAAKDAGRGLWGACGRNG